MTSILSIRIRIPILSSGDKATLQSTVSLLLPACIVGGLEVESEGGTGVGREELEGGRGVGRESGEEVTFRSE